MSQAQISRVWQIPRSLTRPAPMLSLRPLRGCIPPAPMLHLVTRVPMRICTPQAPHTCHRNMTINIDATHQHRYTTSLTTMLSSQAMVHPQIISLVLVLVPAMAKWTTEVHSMGVLKMRTPMLHRIGLLLPNAEVLLRVQNRAPRRCICRVTGSQ